MARYFLMIAASSGLLAVILGAFGAHALRGRLSEAMLSAYQTGVQYQFYHALALLAVALLLQRAAFVQGWLSSAGILFTVGMVLFSGSLYALALGAPRWIGPVTPIGGLCFMAGWLCLLISVWRVSE